MFVRPQQLHGDRDPLQLLQNLHDAPRLVALLQLQLLGQGEEAAGARRGGHLSREVEISIKFNGNQWIKFYGYYFILFYIMYVVYIYIYTPHTVCMCVYTYVYIQHYITIK